MRQVATVAFSCFARGGVLTHPLPHLALSLGTAELLENLSRSPARARSVLTRPFVQRHSSSPSPAYLVPGGLICISIAANIGLCNTIKPKSEPQGARAMLVSPKS